MSRLPPSHPFLDVGSGSNIPRGSISLPVTFGTPENYCTEGILLNVAEGNHPFNAIIGRPALYQFMAISHYGYLFLKMPSPNGIIKICGDCSAGVFTLEKVHALAVTHEVVAGQGVLDQAPLSSCQCVSSSALCVQASDDEDVLVKVIQIGVDAA
jgi:hypothetical protein